MNSGRASRTERASTEKKTLARAAVGRRAEVTLCGAWEMIGGSVVADITTAAMLCLFVLLCQSPTPSRGELRGESLMKSEMNRRSMKSAASLLNARRRVCQRSLFAKLRQDLLRKTGRVCTSLYVQSGRLISALLVLFFFVEALLPSKVCSGRNVSRSESCERNHDPKRWDLARAILLVANRHWAIPAGARASLRALFGPARPEN